MCLDVRHVAVQVKILFAGEFLDKGNDPGIFDILIEFISNTPFLLMSWGHQTVKRGNELVLLAGLEGELGNTDDLFLCFFGHRFVLLKIVLVVVLALVPVCGKDRGRRRA